MKEIIAALKESWFSVLKVVSDTNKFYKYDTLDFHRKMEVLIHENKKRAPRRKHLL